jgi:hypothetical protein
MREYATLRQRGTVTIEPRLRLLEAHQASLRERIAGLRAHEKALAEKIATYRHDLVALQTHQQDGMSDD